MNIEMDAERKADDGSYDGFGFDMSM